MMQQPFWSALMVLIFLAASTIPMVGGTNHESESYLPEDTDFDRDGLNRSVDGDDYDGGPWTLVSSSGMSGFRLAAKNITRVDQGASAVVEITLTNLLDETILVEFPNPTTIKGQQMWLLPFGWVVNWAEQIELGPQEIFSDFLIVEIPTSSDPGQSRLYLNAWLNGTVEPSEENRTLEKIQFGFRVFIRSSAPLIDQHGESQMILDMRPGDCSRVEFSTRLVDQAGIMSFQGVYPIALRRAVFDGFHNDLTAVNRTSGVHASFNVSGSQGLSEGGVYENFLLGLIPIPEIGFQEWGFGRTTGGWNLESYHPFNFSLVFCTSPFVAMGETTSFAFHMGRNATTPYDPLMTYEVYIRFRDVPFRDADLDGVYDFEDHCENTPVNDSTDSAGCGLSQKDSDGDNISDNLDAFPDDPFKTTDRDGDGFADNWLTPELDDCPDEWGNSTEDSWYGCPDSDGDGWADSRDDFPHEPTQWKDSDDDGYGDNWGNSTWNSTWSWEMRERFGTFIIDAVMADAFPVDPTQWGDYDGDGWGDNPNGKDPDAFPLIPSQYKDSDGDGYGDNRSGFEADDCPLEYGVSSRDRFGCRDTDGDGQSDLNDAFWQDSSRWKAEGDSGSDGGFAYLVLISLMITCIGILVAILLFTVRKRRLQASKKF